MTARAVRAVDEMLDRARSLGATDLHLDPAEDELTVRVRRGGVLEPLEPLPADLAPRVVGRLKSLADLLVYRRDVPQEGRVPAERTPVGRELRVATYPTLLGERVAVRLDAPEMAEMPLEDLGFPGPVADDLVRALDRPDGALLLTGPSGAGKTTTLYAALRHVRDAPVPRAIVTIEDPVERRVPGVTQTQVDRPAGLGFARALRSVLRQDPEVIMVGEVRDAETAGVALEAGLTGHLVLSTVHAGRAPAVFSRLLGLGVEPFVLTTAVRGVLAQRLLRATCPACDGGAEGCGACRGTGFDGVVVLAEWLPLSEPVREAILGRADGKELVAAAREAGFVTLHERARRAVAEGRTTEDEVRRVLGPGGEEAT